jgi:hypothetical protein
MTPNARLTLQPYATEPSRLDDVAVSDVDLFRAEMLTKDVLWLACYLPGTGVEGDRVTFLVTIQDGEIRLEVEEQPAGAVNE